MRPTRDPVAAGGGGRGLAAAAAGAHRDRGRDRAAAGGRGWRGRHGLVIDLRGSYGGAHEALWTAKGHADPAHGTGKLSLRAEQFSLGRIADVLPSRC